MRRSTVDMEERRGLTVAQAGMRVVRAVPDDGAEPDPDDLLVDTRLVGHAAVFNSRTAIGNPLTWGWYEEIAPGAFTKTLMEADPRCLIDHDSYYVVSRASAGTLTLAQDATGLSVDSALDAELSYVKDLAANIGNGNITGMSFGFWVVKDEWSTEEVSTSDGMTASVEVRVITEIRLLEVSAVTFPAYEETDIGLRHSLLPALRHRGDVDAITRRLQYRPELAELLDDITATEPGETTRGQSTTDDAGEPGESTPTIDMAPSRSDRMRALAARYRLPA